MQVILATSAIVATGVIVSACEDLSLDRRLFQSNLLDWRYCLALQPKLRPSRSSPFANAAFGPTAFQVTAMMRLLAALFALVFAELQSPYTYIPVLALIFSYFYLFYRLPYALDGADQMTLFVLIGLLLMTIDQGTGSYLRLGAATISLHACVSYYTSGAAKLGSEIWRSGMGLSGVLNSAEFGNELLGRILSTRPWLSLILSWGVMIGHIVVASTIVIGGDLIYLGVAICTLFHISVALLMRLNMFVWAFGATIPSLLFFSDWTQRCYLFKELFGN